MMHGQKNIKLSSKIIPQVFFVPVRAKHCES